MDLLKMMTETPERGPLPRYKSELINIIQKRSQKMS